MFNDSCDVHSSRISHEKCQTHCIITRQNCKIFSKKKVYKKLNFLTLVSDGYKHCNDDVVNQLKFASIKFSKNRVPQHKQILKRKFATKKQSQPPTGGKEKLWFVYSSEETNSIIYIPKRVNGMSISVKCRAKSGSLGTNSWSWM